MQIRKKSDRASKRCGRIVGCIICLFLGTCGMIMYNTQQQAHHKAREGALRGKQEDETVAKQQAQLQLQQKELKEEEKRQRKEDEEVAKYKSEEEILMKKRFEAKQQEQYQELKEQLVKAEQKIASIANVVDGEATVELASSKLPKLLDGEDNVGQIEKVKGLVEEMEAKIKNLESVIT